MFWRHFIGDNPLPQITFVRPATDEGHASFPAAQCSLGLAKIELAFRFWSAVAFEAAAGKDRCHMPVKIRLICRGADRWRSSLAEEKQYQQSESPSHERHRVIPTSPSTIRGG